MDAVAVRTLFARLELRGIVRALTPAYDTYRLPLTHDVEATAEALGERDGAVWRALMAQAKPARVWQTLNLREAARAADVPIASAVSILRRADEEAGAEIKPTGALQRYQVLRRPDREVDTPALVGSVRDAVAGERRRLAAVRGYVLATDCRQAHAVGYLGDADVSACGICDICLGHPPLNEASLPRRDWRRDFNSRAVLEMAAMVDDDDVGDGVGIARALCQVTTTRSRPFRKHRAWGSLERAPYPEVLALVREALGQRP
jgi:ATP-dependent DNA helicase RecQ